MNQVNKDLEHLKLLSIFYYVLAGFCIFPMLYGLIYAVLGVVFGVAMLSADVPNSPGPAPALFGGIFIFVGIIIVAVSAAVAFLLVKAGRNLSKQKSYTFCFVVACIICIFMPFGTVLGVFTLIVLLRDSVKALFNGMNHPQYNTPPNWQ